jgi:hypothetical protein
VSTSESEIEDLRDQVAILQQEKKWLVKEVLELQAERNKGSSGELPVMDAEGSAE